MPSGRKRQFRLEQRLSIDLGTNSGIFEGLVLYPAVAGGSLLIRITSVNDDCSVGEIQEVVRSANYIIREGDLLTTGEVGF